MQKNQSFIVVFSLFVLGVLSVPPAFADSRANSWYRTGYHYSQAGYNKDAFVWMMRAAKAGHSSAQNNIGLSYLHGLGVSKDKNKAFEWFEKAAKQGLSYAQSELAMLYYQQGKTKQAQQWWLTAANANDEYAQFNLASLFLEKNNIKKATYWFQRAKDNNHPQAPTALDRLKREQGE